MRFIKTGPTRGDETAPYNVTDYQAKTVVEFIHEMLEQNPNEWGYIEVKDEPAGNGFHWNTRIEYRYGKLLNEISDTWQSREIDKVDASGGWSRMDYFITTKCPYNYETTTTEKIIMTTQDIMIGDWVKDGNVYAQVTAITCDGIIETTHNPHSNIELIEPIPLTAEILKENEFVKAVENEHGCNYLLLIPTGYKEKSYTIQFTFYNKPISGVNTLFNCWGPTSSEGCGVNDIHMCNIESVHELQHVFNLCKIGKEIKI